MVAVPSAPGAEARGPRRRGWGTHKWGYPKINASQWKNLLKWMIWGYPILGTPHMTENDQNHLDSVVLGIFIGLQRWQKHT